jgi:ribosomal protein S12 methylthiotransferase
MILEYADKRTRFVDKVFVTGCLSERYRPDLEKKYQYRPVLEPLSYRNYLKALGADYKHELLGERLTTTQKNYAYLKLPKVATDLAVFVRFR